MLRVAWNAFDRTHLLTLRLIEMADAFGAFVRVDHVDFRAHRDCVVRALGLADVTIDALVGNHQSHTSLTKNAALSPSLLARRIPNEERGAPVLAGAYRRSGLRSLHQGCAADGGAISATFSTSHFSTDGNTNLLTSPPNCAISRTIVPEMNWYWSDGVMNIVSTSGSK